MNVVITSGQNATERGTYDVVGRVVSEDVLWIFIGRPIPLLVDSLADGEGWVETCPSVVIDRAESPEHETDSGYAVDAEIWSNCVLSGHMENEENKDECAEYLHVKSGPIVA